MGDMVDRNAGGPDLRVMHTVLWRFKSECCCRAYAVSFCLIYGMLPYMQQLSQHHRVQVEPQKWGVTCTGAEPP
eukprot:738-Eustigmatos_ZCMA.PRE.1